MNCKIDNVFENDVDVSKSKFERVFSELITHFNKMYKL